VKWPDLKVGDLVKWIDYTKPNSPIACAGIFLRHAVSPTDFRDIVVFHNGKETLWCAFQCEVINESR
jgi:hypothetical protein